MPPRGNDLQVPELAELSDKVDYWLVASDLVRRSNEISIVIDVVRLTYWV